MRYFDTFNAKRPEGIENKGAHIIGGGIAGLAAAVFLIDDGYMDGRKITIYEKLAEMGGSMDGTKNEAGYLCRGERELEPHMECLWYLFSKIPSIDSPGMTVLDETVEANREDHIYAHSRVLHKQGKVYEAIHSFKTSDKLKNRMLDMMVTPEEELENLTIDEFFGDTAPELYESSMWICFHSMLAFKDYHSLIEMKRYMIRFIMYLPDIDHLAGIMHTKHNEYDSMIKPLKAWLKQHGVQMVSNVSIYDLEMDAACNTVTALKLRKEGQESTIPVCSDELVIVTSGSMTTNSTFGDNTHIAPTNRDTQDMGAFTLWQNLAKKDAKFGHPEKFLGKIDKTKWMSIFVTVKDYPDFFKRVYETYGYKPNTTTGAITILDSAWDISMVFYPKYYPDQKDTEQVFWFDTLYGERTGDYIKKPSSECTGEEIMTEFLYHMGMLDMKDDILAHSYISTCMMPYITSQFMPRQRGDRPSVIPEGCTNLALIGQFVELPGDVVFTVETSVRTAMMAAYGLLNLDKPVVALYEGQWDIRLLVSCLKKLTDKKELDLEDLPPINPLKIKSELKKLLAVINSIPQLDHNKVNY